MKYYNGKLIEQGNTSIKGKVTPAILSLYKDGYFNINNISNNNNDITILDYGAGREGGRNTLFLREKGYRVYAFDPFHGKDNCNGWKAVSNVLPDNDFLFDIAFTSYVLNIVQKSEEENILNWISSHSNKSFHLVRDDLFSTTKKALHPETGSARVLEFFLDIFEGNYNDLQNDKIINEFIRFGYITGKGKFQREVNLDYNKYSLIQKYNNSNKWKVYFSI